MKKFLIAGIALVLMLATLASVWACPAPTKQVPDQILIGDVVSYTGVYSSFAGLSSFGAKAAVEDINAQGGIYVEEYGTRIPVKWITVDCQSDPLKVSTLTEDLILRQNINFIGGGCEVPPLREATAILADKYKIPAVIGAMPFELWQAMKQSSGAEWKYTWALGIRLGAPFPPGDYRAANPNGYCIMPTYLGCQEAFADQTNKKVAVFAMDDSDGRPWYLAFTEMSNAAGYDCYGADQQFGIYPPGTTDFTSLIQEWKNAGCEILWGSAPPPDIGTILKQSKALGFYPKIVFAVRGAMFYQDIASWGGDLPDGVCTEVYWTPDIAGAQGIGDTTGQSLADRWYQSSGNEPVPQGIGWAYGIMQTLFDGIERAGTLDPDAVNEALASTDLQTMWGRVVFVQPEQHSSCAAAFSQWQKTDSAWGYENPVIYSTNNVLPVTGQIIFPKSWD
jgi:branched-chain amino acid transport system substrate-binding protein